MSSTDGTQRRTPSGRAPRGTACLDCRRRKLRCDGVRPVCGQCVRTNRVSECEYTDGPSLSPTQALEEAIGRLSTRIHELEHPEEATPPILLHNPGSVGEHSAAPSSRISLVSSERISTSSSPTQVIRMLVNFFLPHASQVGFFLNKARFFEILRSPNDATRQQQLSPGLLNAIFLWGVQFSSDASLLSQEQAFVSLASQSLATALIDPPRDNHTLMIQILQAEVLLSSYFFSRCRDLEGQYHCSAAVSLALSCGLHQIKSSHSPPGDIAPSPLVASRLPAARDATEENERIDAFWAVYVLERSWAFVSGSQIQLTDVGPVQIDTPWPMDGDRTDAIQSNKTIHRLLSGQAPLTARARISSERSVLALRAQAATLFESAVRVATQCKIGLRDRSVWQQDYMRLDSIIDSFVASLPTMDSISGSTNKDLVRGLLVVHTFARIATIELDAGLQGLNPSRNDKDLSAARAVAFAVLCSNAKEMRHLDPILAVLWGKACKQIIASRTRMPAEQATPEATRDLKGMLNTILAAIESLSSSYPVMASRAEKVRAELVGAGLR